MHLAFIDIVYGYNANRPDTDEPLGGTTSAICFLARELTKAGITCTLFNTIAEPDTVHGIRSLPLAHLIDESQNPDISAFIFCGRWMEGMVTLLRQRTTKPLIAWMHESTFNPKLVPALDAFDGIAFVSEWQKRINQSYVKSTWKQVVIRNAMNPKAAHLFAPHESITKIKTQPPILLFAGGMARGAFHLPPIIEKLRALHTDFTVEIFCNTNPSGDAAANEAYIQWMRKLPHITHVGMVGQTELIKRMRAATFFVSPNPWPETSCIALIEALASGLSVITTNRAALPETASGFAHHIAIDAIDDPMRFDHVIAPEVFAHALHQALKEWSNDPIFMEEKLSTQVKYFLDHYQWHQRVKPWVDFIRTMQETI